MGLAGRDAEEPQASGSYQAEPASSSTPARPRDGGMNGFRGPRTAVLPPPNPVEAWYYEGMAAYQHRRWDEALEYFTRLKELQPTRPGLDALLDEVRWFQQLQAAAPAFDGAEAPAPSRGEIVQSWWRRLAPLRTALLVILAVFGIASLLFAALEGRFPWQNGADRQEIDALFSQAEERRAIGDYDGAELAFKKILAISPDSPEAKLGVEHVQRERELAQHYAAADAAIAEESWERARSELDAILAVDPGYKDARSLADFAAQRQTLAKLYTDASLLYARSQWNEALARFETMRELDASYRGEAVGEALFTCYIYAGQDLLATQGTDLSAVERAVDYFDRALKLAPNHPVASHSRRLGGLYLGAMQAAAAGDAERARSQLGTLLAEDPYYAGGAAMHQLYALEVAEGQKALAGGNILVALGIFEQAQGLPVDDRSAARNGYELAKAAAATPTPTASAAPSSTPAPAAAPAILPATPRPPAAVRARPTNTPVLVSCIRGHVYDVAGGAPLRDWAVTLADAAGAARTIISGDAGQYRFDNLAPGRHKVWVAVPTGWRVISPQPAQIEVAPAADCLAVDFWSERERVDRVSKPTPER